MPHTSLEFTYADLEARVETDSRPINHAIDHSAEIDIEAGEVTVTIIGLIIDPTIGTGPETNIGMITEEIIITGLVISKIIIGKIVEETISTKTMDRTTHRSYDSQQRYMDRGESRDRSRNYDGNNSRSRYRHRDRQDSPRTRTLSDDRGNIQVMIKFKSEHR